MALFAKLPNWASILITVTAAVIAVGLVSWGTYTLVKPSPSNLPEGEEQPAGEKSPAKEDQFKDWKTYTNTTYGFETKYPTDWSVNLISDKIINLLPADKNPLKGIKIFIDDNPQQLSLREFYNGKHGYADLFNDAAGGYTSLDLDGKSATRFKDVLGLITGDVVVIPLNINKINIRVEEGVDNGEIFNQILSTFKFTDVTADWKTYRNTTYGFEFKHNPNWSIALINTGSGYDASRPFVLVWAGTTSDAPCQDLGCPPKSGDRETLTKGDTLEGAPPLNPWFKILWVRGNKWVSIQVTDASKNCSSEAACQQYLSGAPLEQRLKVNDSDYQTYNDFVELLSTFKFTK